MAAAPTARWVVYGGTTPGRLRSGHARPGGPERKAKAHTSHAVPYSRAETASRLAGDVQRDPRHRHLILLALGLEQCVEWAHWKEKVAEGEAQLSEETLAAVALSAQYVAVSPCVHSQLSLVRQHLLQDAGRHTPLPRLSDEPEAFVVRVPTTPKYSTKWQALITDGTVTQLDSARASRCSQFHESADQPRQISQLAFDQARNRLVLSDPVVIDNATAVRELEIVERLASLSTTNRSVAMRALRFYRDLGFDLPERRLDTYVEHSAVGRFCKAHGYPIDDWRKAFEEKRPQMSV